MTAPRLQDIAKIDKIIEQANILDVKTFNGKQSAFQLPAEVTITANEGMMKRRQNTSSGSGNYSWMSMI